MEGSSSNSLMSTAMVKLNSTNYSIWKPRMEDLLFVRDLYDPIEGDEKKPEGKSDEEWAKLNRKAVATIRQWVEDSVFHHISTETNASSLWKKLAALYEPKSAQNKAFLIRRLVNLKYQQGSSVSDHLSLFQDCVNRLVNLQMEIDDEMQALLLLSSLPDSWETLVVSLSNSTANGKLSLDVVKDSMLNEELRRKEHGNDHSQALVNERKGRTKSRGQGDGSRNKSRGRSKGRSMKDVICFNCGKKGHMKRSCTKGPKKEDAKEDGDASTAEEAVIAYDVGCVNISLHETTWVVDSGASFHITPNRELFALYEAGGGGVVRMGNDQCCPIVGRGTVVLETQGGVKLHLKNVRHVPGVRMNLLSTGALDDEGYISKFGGGEWKLSRGSLVMAKGKKQASLYMMRGRSCGDVHVASEDQTNLWHQRLGHMSEKGMKILAQKKVIPVSGILTKVCEHCMAGKQHRTTFFHRTSKCRRPLELVHTDVCSMGARTLGGASYFVTFIDDYSRKVWVFALKTKDQVLDVFKTWHLAVERETGKRLKTVRSDNGGEYRGPFEAYCRSHGIRTQRTVPKTPQQNGVAERMNRTLTERVRAMLSHSKLPKSFWGEALYTAAYVINLSPSYPLEGDYPEHVWRGKHVLFDHLRVFGCRVYVHVPSDERGKLDAKTRECIFLGYGQDEFGYRLWDPTRRKIVRSRDVVFVEDQTLEDIHKTPSKTVQAPGEEELEVPLPQTPEEDARVEGDAMEDGVEGGNPPNAMEDGIEDPVVEPEVQVEQPQLRRSARVRNQSEQRSETPWLRGWSPRDSANVASRLLLTDGGEPEDFAEVANHADAQHWRRAMKEEMDALRENKVYDLVPLPKGARVLRNKWVFRLKTEADGSKRFKARLVVKGFEQKRGIDFDEIFSPVVKMTSIRSVLALVSSQDLELEQMDVKTAFLHGDVEEELYMEQPEGFIAKKKDHLVCRLKKSLYGLKQAPRNWYRRFDMFMSEHGFTRNTADTCVFMRGTGLEQIILLLYVDDMLIVGKNVTQIRKLKGELNKSFAMKDLGAARQILGMRIVRDRRQRKLWLSQKEYIEKVLDRYNMGTCKPVCTPLAAHHRLSKEDAPKTQEERDIMEKVPYASAVGSLMYAMICTRPDIAHSVGVVSRYMADPGKKHWDAVKWIMRYLKGTISQCLCYGDGSIHLEAYTDADWAGDVDSRKSTSGFLITLGGGAIAWQSRMQKCISLSTTEAEYVAVTEAAKELLWCKELLQGLGVVHDSYTLMCDSLSAIYLSRNPMFHARSKHIELRHHWIRDALENKELKLVKVDTEENGADMLTKTVPQLKLQVCKDIAGLKNCEGGILLCSQVLQPTA